MPPKTPAEPEQRTQAIRAAARLLWTRGLHRTPMKQVLAESGTPRGSVYFYFPRGKVELAHEAVKTAQTAVGHALEKALLAPTVAAGMRRFVADIEQRMNRARFNYGCPIGTATVEAMYWSDEIRRACDQAFAQWRERLALRLQEDGLPAQAAAQMATLLVCTIEGAMILCQAQRSTEPLHTAMQGLLPLLSVRKD